MKISFQKISNNRQEAAWQKLGQVQTTHWFESIKNLADHIYFPDDAPCHRIWRWLPFGL